VRADRAHGAHHVREPGAVDRRAERSIRGTRVRAAAVHRTAEHPAQVHHARVDHCRLEHWRLCPEIQESEHYLGGHGRHHVIKADGIHECYLCDACCAEALCLR
jgi:hypothetical protein